MGFNVSGFKFIFELEARFVLELKTIADSHLRMVDVPRAGAR